MQTEEIISQLFEIIAEIVPDEDLTDFDPDIPIMDQLEVDSVAFLAVMMEVQERYGIEVPEEDYIELTTINRCAAYLEGRRSV